jgi:fumarate reductase flavoprotein subunit
MSNKGKEGMNRRNFMKMATIGAGAAAMLTSFDLKDALAKMPKKWDMDVDIVVVGGGGAGLSAATEAASRGAKVVVLEKTPALGGSSLICGGALAFAGTDMQEQKNVKDSNELFFKDLMKVGGDVNDKAMVKAYIDNQLDTYKWLKGLGVIFKGLGIASGMSVPRSHYVTPSQVIKTLGDAAKAKGAKVFLDRGASRLVLDEKTGRIRGVKVEKGGKASYYGAKKGVILGSGGFSRNKELLAKFVPPMTNAKAMVGLGCYGDGLKMAWASGADIQDMPYIKATFGFDTEASSMADFALVYYKGALIVNKAGKRFVNESISYKLVGDAALMQPDAVGYQIYDSAIRAEANKDQLAKTEALEKKGRIKQANTIGELASAIGIAPAVLEATVNEYNANVEKGSDPLFGRNTLVSSFGKPVKIDKPPFYAMISTAYILGTYGGIRCDEKARVVNIYGEAVPGLYGAGEILGGVHGAAYMTGTAFGKALIFGRLAAKSILA